MKTALKKTVARILGWQVRRLVGKNDIRIVAVVGSIGKTSTKLAVAHTLKQQFKVIYQEGNYNDQVTIPLVLFEEKLGSLFNPIYWLGVFIRNELKLVGKYRYEVAVLELGTDGPGQMKRFGDYLRPDIAIVTAVAPEHMEYFADLAAVAREELSAATFSRHLLVNSDLVADKYVGDRHYTSYGIKSPAHYQLRNIRFKGSEASFEVWRGNEKLLTSSHQQITEPQLYSITAAAAVALMLDVSVSKIDTGISSIPQVNGRMQHLAGINGSLILDDTYNASPEAARAALDTLCRLPAKQRIAVLGNMNELGKYSKEEHEAIGDYIDKTKIHQVLTIGPDANGYLAPKAAARGIAVEKFDDPVLAGVYLTEKIKPGAVILVKGSQNRVFAEETVKQILADKKDAARLVRQSAGWLKIKHSSFPSVKIR